MGRWWVKTRGKNCQQKHEMSIFCLEAKSTPPNELVFCLNRYAVEVGEEIRVFSLARGFDRHDQRKDVQRRKNLAEAKATFNHHLLLFFSLENQNLIFLCCGSCYAPFFFPKTILFSKHFAWSVLSLVVFKTSISCAMPCWTVLPLRRLEDDFASAQRNDASCLCWHFLSSCLYSQPCHESSCRNLFVLLFLREPNSCAFNGGECCRCDQCSFFPYT